MLTLISLFSVDAAEAALAGGNSFPEVANPQRIELRLEKQVMVELRDYRDPPDDATFEKMSSLPVARRKDAASRQRPTPNRKGDKHGC
jgi:hypothetical protein